MAAMGEDLGLRETSAGDPPRDADRRSLEHWLVLCVPLAGLVLMAVLALAVEPDPRGFGTHEKLGLPACKSMEWFGIPCPGCGVTTSVALASRGRLLDSIRNQPFGIVTVLGILVSSVWTVRGHLRGRDLYRDLQVVRWRPWTIGLGSALAATWIYKVALVFGAFS